MSRELQRLLGVALDAKLSLAGDPAEFLRSLRLQEGWEVGSAEAEEAAEAESLSFDPDLDDSTPSLSLPESFEKDLTAEYILKARDALRMPQTMPTVAEPPRRDWGAVEGRLRNEIAELRARLDERLDSLHGLEVSEATYLDLRSRPESQLTLRETALLRLGDVLIPLRRELDGAHAALEEHKAALRTSSLTVEMQIEEMERQRRAGQQAAEGLRLEKLSLEATAAGLSQQLEREIALRKTNDEKASLFDEAAAELRRLREENAALVAAAERRESLVAHLTESEAAMRQTLADANGARERLQQDKEYLSSETRELQLRCDSLGRELESSVSRALGLEVRLAEVTDSLLLVQRTARSEAEERLEREVRRLREDSARELELVRSGSRELAERENRVLREARDAAEGELRRVSALLERQTDERIASERSARHLASTQEAELSSLRGELRVKAFELTALGAALEDRATQLRLTRADLELLRGEVAAHKSAIAELERSSEVQVLRLTAELEAARSRLQTYLCWEREMDSAVLHAAGGPEFASALDSLIRGGAVSNDIDRRVAQCVQLAQKLRAAEARCSEQELLISELQAETAKMRATIERSAVDTERMDKPASYLVRRLRDVEDELECERKSRVEAEAELTKSLTSLRLSEAERDDMRERLETVLRQREELETIRRALEQLREEQLAEEEEGEGSSDDDVEAEPQVRRIDEGGGPGGPSTDAPAVPLIQSLGLTAEMVRRMTTPQRSPAEKRWLRRVVFDG